VKKIVVIGSSNTDMIVKVPKIPAPGETVLGNEFLTVQGGKGANQAVAAARAGGEVTFVACVGNDTFGDEAVASYKKEGINTNYIKRTGDAATGVALINVAASGENSISVAPGANSLLTPSDIEQLDSLIHSADIILMQMEIPLQTIQKVAEMASVATIPVILNPAPAQKLPKQLLEMISLLTPNEHEAALIAGTEGNQSSPQELAEILSGMGVKQSIITLGSNGAYFYNDHTSGTVKGMKVDAIDTTAAGDTFNGYLAVAMASGESIDHAIQIANKAAAISVTRLGAQPSIPRMKEIVAI
jgi:ribokinase